MPFKIVFSPSARNFRGFGFVKNQRNFFVVFSSAVTYGETAVSEFS